MSKVIEINNDADKIEVDDVDKIDFDKIDVDENDVDKIFEEPHNGKSITRIEISPNEKYLITYSEEDRSIFDWNVEETDKVQLKFHQVVKTNNEDNEIYKYEIKSLCISDDKKLAYITCKIIHNDNVIATITGW
ncbi:unnamed protein product [Rhizophagus irregularis]|uniref:Uncharacterized protein n=1 Tax=Rhizophagus irregularis TaxID=588596 RepID=A0A2I1HK36_9GLOM|nr:hypothetical protein RhiirA4_461518 [Rhizophagus irregularis]PKY59247.1 hypothetical protein RhiirA4_481829 [Rhizophagus irregularis]CAB4441639.1 unnamed protein product [Rhizophagus irregularis]